VHLIYIDPLFGLVPRMILHLCFRTRARGFQVHGGHLGKLSAYRVTWIGRYERGLATSRGGWST
jgi:hypothetical protein